MFNYLKAKKEAVKKAGGDQTVAKDREISPQAVNCWGKVPAKHVVRLAELSGMKPWEIRPDLYPPEVFAA